MAWAIETYAGNSIYDPDDGGRLGMHQLFIAINEREAAVGETETEWLMPDGVTEKSQPTAAELIGANVVPSSTIETNCTRIKNAITALVDLTDNGNPVFVDADKSDTEWTIASLQTDIGLGTWANSTSPQDSLFLQIAKEICDRLLYIRLVRSIDGSATRYANTSGNSTRNDAWTDLTGSSVSIPAASDYYNPPGAGSVGWTGKVLAWGSNENAGDAACCILDEGTIELDLTGYAGTVSQSNWAWSQTAGSDSPTFDCTVGSMAFAHTTSDSGTKNNTTDITALGGTTSIAADIDSIPATINNSPTFDWAASLDLDDVIIYGDISNQLTDQA